VLIKEQFVQLCNLIGYLRNGAIFAVFPIHVSGNGSPFTLSLSLQLVLVILP
jgi:hypothetical protein